MERKHFVTVNIREAESTASPHCIELGEFHATWKDGVSIGSDRGCTVALPGLAPVAVRVVAASDHKLLYRLPEGTSLPLPPVTYPLSRYDERVDEGEFRVGPYIISVGGVSREE
jgi:hypothetical protein